jgi:phosphohistidine phosphatase
MKRLVIIRHAKAEQGGYDRDFERQLTEKGKDDAHNVAADLKEWDIYPDYIISSPANRALTTARIFAEVLKYPKDKILEKKGLYFDYTTQEFLDLVHEVDDAHSTLFIFGHNPFMYFMAESLCDKFKGDMPTCSTVVINYDVSSWKNIEARQGHFFLHLYPKLYSF